MPDQRFLDAIFCDDIRQEIGGKLTVVGAYPGGMVVGEIPITLPKISVLARLFTPVDSPFQRLAIRLRVDDSTLAEMSIDSEELKRQPVPPDAASRWFVANAALSVAPFRIERPCTVFIEAECEDGVLVSPKLKVFTAVTATQES